MDEVTATYNPPPGSTPYRVLAYMETLPAGAEIMTSALAEALGLEGKNVAPCLETALANGRIFRRQRDTHVRSPYWWSLTDYSAIPKAERPVLEIPNTPPKGANRVRQVLKAEGASPDATDSEARSKVMAAEGSERPTARGENVAPALGAAPAFIPPESPRVGAMGAGQPADAGPAGEAPQLTGAEAQDFLDRVLKSKPAPAVDAAPEGPTRFALWSDGTLHIQRPRSGFVLTVEESRALVAYLDSISLDSVRGEGGA